MVRALAQQLRPLLAQLNSFANGQAFAQYAVPAVAVPQSGGLFGSKRVTTPLSEPLPGVIMPNITAPKAPELKVHSTGYGGVGGLHSNLRKSRAWEIVPAKRVLFCVCLSPAAAAAGRR